MPENIIREEGNKTFGQDVADQMEEVDEALEETGGDVEAAAATYEEDPERQSQAEDPGSGGIEG